jgi:hypothetical protein
LLNSRQQPEGRRPWTEIAPKSFANTRSTTGAREGIARPGPAALLAA